MSKLTPLQATAPRKIWLQISDDADHHTEPFPEDWHHNDSITWCADSVTACQVGYVREDLAAVPAGAEPVAEVFTDAVAGSRVAMYSPLPDRTKLYAAPTAQPQPQPERTVLFDDRPQNQRIAEAEERMRNPAPLQWEDGAGPAQPERLPYVSALDPELRGGVPAEPSTFEDVEQKIVARYRVESKHSGYWGYCVKAGDGNMELFSGHRKQCDLVAAALQTACLDGAFMARTAQPEAPAEPSVTDAMISAYLQANSAYWRSADELPLNLRDPSKWRSGTPREATLVGLRAALTLATPAPAAPAEPESFDDAFEDVYNQCCMAIKPLVDFYDYPGSVVETVQMLAAERLAAPVARQPAELTDEASRVRAVAENIRRRGGQAWESTAECLEKIAADWDALAIPAQVAELTDAQIDDLSCEWVYIRAGTESEQYAELRRLVRAAIKAQGGSQ
ncbi:hypothetical protein [Rhizobacter sp. OV335]|uniref:hypothetical protein n=1 Tax=Rhizobacter sp. OV335 TaxID=1500264 RepID=UPI00091141B4|nr:hypothetical protein [Rhizobacter sp. OV335]SHN40403.1 hypothetical protein SAMN02787076_06240 [Rhizobacter sp. OV335]